MKQNNSINPQRDLLAEKIKAVRSRIFEVKHSQADSTDEVNAHIKSYMKSLKQEYRSLMLASHKLIIKDLQARLQNPQAGDNLETMKSALEKLKTRAAQLQTKIQASLGETLTATPQSASTPKDKFKAARRLGEAQNYQPEDITPPKEHVVDPHSGLVTKPEWIVNENA